MLHEKKSPFVGGNYLGQIYPSKDEEFDYFTKVNKLWYFSSCDITTFFTFFEAIGLHSVIDLNTCDTPSTRNSNCFFTSSSPFGLCQNIYWKILFSFVMQ